MILFYSFRTVSTCQITFRLDPLSQAIIRLPNPTTPEDLECRWSKVLNFGDKVLLAGYYYNGKNKPCYFGAVYEHLDDDLSCEGTIGLRSASEVAFEDDGHAMAWAMAHTED